MKNIKYYIMLAMTMVFAACSQEEEVDVPTVCPPAGERVEITVGVNGKQNNSRVSYQDDAPNFKWQQGDQIVVLGFNSVEGKDVCQFAEDFTMKGDVAAGGTSATFVGILRSADKIKVLYKAKNLTYDATQPDGKIVMNYEGQAQKGNANTAHLKDYMLIGAHTTVEALMSGKLKLSLLNSIFRFDIASVDPIVGGHLTELEWYRKYKLTLSEITTASPIQAYLCFDPAQLSYIKGDRIDFFLTGERKVRVSAVAAAPVTYQPGHRYTIQFAKDADAAHHVLGNMIPLRTSKREIWAKSDAPLTAIEGYEMKTFEGSQWTKYVSATDLTEIAADMFKDAGLTECLIPYSVTTIGANAFANCPLTSFEITKNVNTVGANAFSGCAALQELVIYALYSGAFDTASFNGLNTADIVLYLNSRTWFEHDAVDGANFLGHDWKDIKSTDTYTGGLQGFPGADQAESMY